MAKFVPFVAVASAGCVNIGLMRWKEIRDGKFITNLFLNLSARAFLVH